MIKWIVVIMMVVTLKGQIKNDSFMLFFMKKTCAVQVLTLSSVVDFLYDIL